MRPVAWTPLVCWVTSRYLISCYEAAQQVSERRLSVLFVHLESESAGTHLGILLRISCYEAAQQVSGSFYLAAPHQFCSLYQYQYALYGAYAQIGSPP